MPLFPTAVAASSLISSLFSGSDTTLQRNAFLQFDARTQVVREAKDNNANFAWVQHFIHHLAPQRMADLVLANGSTSCNQFGD